MTVTRKKSKPAAAAPVEEVRRIVSSEHLVSERCPELSELEFGLIIASHAFGRWMTRCMAGAELRQPLGLAVVGGLLLSQAVTLYITPVIYLALDRWAGTGPITAEVKVVDSLV